MKPASSRSTAGTMAIASAATVIDTLPPYFSGVLVVQLTSDLGFGVAAFGVAMAIYYAIGAALSFHLGRFVDVLGAARSMRIALTMTMISALGIATLTTRWAGLVLFLAIGGAAHALAQPAVNRLLVNRVPPKNMGIAFGVKQSAPPVGSLFAGFAAPLIALTFGWRTSYFVAAGLALIVIISVGPPRVKPTGLRDRPKRTPLPHRSTIMLLILAFSFAFGANAVSLAFYVDAAVAAGVSQQQAGAFFALASFVSVVTRLAAGIVLDRTDVVPLRLAGILVGVGSVGFVLLATGRTPLMVVGVVFALGFTWGFPSSFWIGLMRVFSDQPGRITGAMQPAGFGAMVAPLVFGVIVESRGYAVGWLFIGVIALIASALFLWSSVRLDSPPRETV